MKRLTAITLTLGICVSSAMLGTLPADAHKAKHAPPPHKDGSYTLTCTDKNKTCANWNILGSHKK